MRISFWLHKRPLDAIKFSTPLLFGILGLAGAAAAQTLTPGAAAIGGTTTDAELIAPGGTRVGNGAEAPETRTLHSPDPNWPLILPAPRDGDGRPVESGVQVAQPTRSTPNTAPSLDTSDTQTNTSSAAVASSPTVDPAPSPASNTEAETTSIPTAGTAADTTQVTAGASSSVATQADPIPESVANTPALDPLAVFERAALDFGTEGVTLTAQHEIALDPVVALMMVSPQTPLRVAAILPQASASDEEAKLRARRRILAVRTYLIEQGLSAENLNFVISSNSTTEPFANNVLVERQQ